MKRSHVAKDILDAVQACMVANMPAERCHEYVFARTRGIPPADCNSITVSWMDAADNSFADCRLMGVDGCGREWDTTRGIRIVLTRVCMGPDQSESFDWQREDAEAACFDDDLDLLEECVKCMDWSQLVRDHSLTELFYAGTTHDVESDGGGYSAYIELTVVAAECCSIAPVPPTPLVPPVVS